MEYPPIKYSIGEEAKPFYYFCIYGRDSTYWYGKCDDPKTETKTTDDGWGDGYKSSLFYGYGKTLEEAQTNASKIYELKIIHEIME